MKTIKQIEDSTYWSINDVADYLLQWNQWRKTGLGDVASNTVLSEIVDAAIANLRVLDQYIGPKPK